MVAGQEMRPPAEHRVFLHQVPPHADAVEQGADRIASPVMLAGTVVLIAVLVYAELLVRRMDRRTKRGVGSGATESRACSSRSSSSFHHSARARAAASPNTRSPAWNRSDIEVDELRATANLCNHCEGFDRNYWWNPLECKDSADEAAFRDRTSGPGFESPAAPGSMAAHRRTCMSPCTSKTELPPGIQPGPMALCHSSAIRLRHHQSRATQEGWGRRLPLQRSGSGEVRRLLTINVAVLLAVIVVIRLRRRTHSRSRLDEKFTVVIVLALGVLIAPTPVGRGIMDFLGRLASGVTQAGR